MYEIYIKNKEQKTKNKTKKKKENSDFYLLLMIRKIEYCIFLYKTL